MEASSTTSTMVSSDPVSSLRAAALSSRKSKRRKPAVEQPVTLSLRPPPPIESFQLDYGQEDITDTVPSVNSIPCAPDTLEKEEKIPLPSEDIQMREEGEISDEEGPPPLPILSNDQIPEPVDTPVLPNPEPKEPSPSILVTPSPPRSLTPEAPRTVSLMDRISDPVTDDPAQMSELHEDPDSPMLDTFEQPPEYDVGPERVRPGVELTQDEYDTVKDIILDLLGWGVPFDYLIECGISEHLIFYVFNELDLCLPDTFDSSGIVPYNPEIFSEGHQSDVIPPPIPERRGNSIDSDGKVETETPSNPVNPLISTNEAPPSFDNLKGADLHDMERLRRQELMARKAAVQASRKQKQSVSFESSTEPSLPRDSMIVDQDKVEVPPYAATETVEDFLNSLGTVQGLDTSSRTQIFASAQHFETKTSDHDQSIYDQVVDMKDHGHDGPLNSSISESFSISSVQSETFTAAPPSSSEPPPSSVESSTSTFSQMPVPVPDATQRRGVKRPVASDFVDLDPPPKRHENSRIDRLNVTGGITRRLNSRMSFQNINSRRCVIDLSDSEDDDEEQPQRSLDEPPQQVWRDKLANSVKFASPAPIKPISSGTVSPATLEQKELEIRRMRELIAKREEETRLRKLALARSASMNTNSSITSTAVAQTEQVKIEEVDSIIMSTNEANVMSVHAPERFPCSESPTPPLADADRREHSFTPEVPGVPSNLQEPQAGSPHISDGEGQGLPEQSVDTDQTSSPSAQLNSESKPPVLQRQDTGSQDHNEPRTTDENDQDDTFSSYRSPFDMYPLLRSQRQLVSSSSHSLFSRSSYSHMYSSRPSLSSDSISVDTEKSGFYSSNYSSSSLLPDLKPLRLATLAKSLDPFKRLCQYEVPGGGTCRDDGCEDIHLSRLEDANQVVALEPNDEDTANYLFDKLPPPWLHDHHVASPSRILSALLDIHHRDSNNHLKFEDRVLQALDSLGQAPTT